MNLLLLVEGKRTEKKLYKNWIPYIIPSMIYVDSISDLSDNSFTIISGEGYPQYFEKIKRACQDIEKISIIDCLVICIDSEKFRINEKFQEVNDFIQNECPHINCEIKIIIQNSCIESWLMGNKKLNINNANNSDLIAYRNHHNVNIYDPEELICIDNRTIGQFTYDYFRLMMRNKSLHYSKNNVNHVNTLGFFRNLIKRFQDDQHIKSFGYFYNTIFELF